MATSLRYDTGEVELAYDEWAGTAPPLVILHGLSGRRAMLDLAEAREGHRAYAYDHRGHGDSGRTPGEYTFVNFGRDTVAFLQGAVREPALLIGHSLGAMTALFAAANAPELVRAAFLIDPPLYAPEVGLRNERGPFSATASQAGTPATDLISAGVPAPRAEALSKLDATMMPMAVDSTMFAGWDTDAYLRTIECPITLEHGDNDLGSAIYPGELARASGLLRDVQVLHLEGTGHRPQLEAREVLLDAVRRFIRES